MENVPKSRIVIINEWIAVKSTMLMSTMWCVYLFLFWSMLPLFWTNITTFDAYISSDIIQLVSLPLIMVGQQVVNRASEKRSINDHKKIIKEFNLLKEENLKLDILIEKIEALEKKIANFTSS